MSEEPRQRSATLGPDARPVAITDDVDDPSIAKAKGKVKLPLRVRWTGVPRQYDLDDPAQRARVYEQVLSEGTEDDIRRFIDVDVLAGTWEQLVLPPGFASRGPSGSVDDGSSTFGADRAPAARRDDRVGPA